MWEYNAEERLRFKAFSVSVMINGSILESLLLHDDTVAISLKIHAKYVIFGSNFDATLEDIEWEGILNQFEYQQPVPTN